jgi:hypothetical protein
VEFTEVLMIYQIYHISAFSGYAGVLVQGFVLARQVLYFGPFSLVIFEIESHFLPRQVWTMILLF